MPSVKLVKVMALSRGSLSVGCQTIRTGNNLSQRAARKRKEDKAKIS